MKHLISFLTLLVLGWGSAWGMTEINYPYTWDFSNWTTTNLSGGWANNNDGSFTFQSYCTSQEGELVNGGYGSGGTTNGYSSIIEETKGLKFACGRWDRNILYTTGTPGIAARTLEITVPHLMYGNVVKFYTDGNNTLTTDAGTITKDGTTHVFTVPNTYTSPTDITFVVGANNTKMLITKIEVTKTEVNPKANYYDVVNVNGNNSSYKTAVNSGEVTIPFTDGYNTTSSLRFQLLTDVTGLTIADLCGGTLSVETLNQYFTFTSTNPEVIDVGSISYSLSNSKFYINNIQNKKPGTTTLSLTYLGNGGFAPFTINTLVTIDKGHVQIGHRGSDSGWNSKFLDSGDWNMPVTLRDINDNTITRQGYTTSDFNITIVSDPELTYDPASDVVSLLNKSISTGSGGDEYLSQKLHANHTGIATLQIEFLGNDLYYPTSDFTDITVKEHFATLQWIKDGVEVDEYTTQTTTGTLTDSPTLVKTLDSQASDFAVTYVSSNTNVATIDANGVITIKGIGVSVITARIQPSKITWEGVDYFYYNEASQSYTLIVQGNAANEPKIIWVTAGKTDQNGVLNTYGYGNNGRGSYLGQQYVQNKGLDITAGYGNNILVTALALKSTVSDNDLAEYGILPIPGSPYPNHYYVVDNTGGWRPSRTDCIPQSWRFNESDEYFTKVNYMVDKPEMVRSTNKVNGNGNNNQTRYQVTPNSPSQDPLRIYAFVDGCGTYSYTEILVEPGDLQLHFVPDENTVNEGNSISPYVNIPDLRLEDVNKIWLTYECNDVLSVANNGVVYETGKTTQADIAKYLYTVTANDTIWINVDDANNYNADGTPNMSKVYQIKSVTWLRGVNPEIFGVAGAASLPDPSCTVTLHLTSDMYNEATADYTLRVVGDADVATMFHWELNDKVESGKHVDDGAIKTIKIVEGDYVYMPGIYGNSNGNNEYSAAYSYKYVYSMNNGQIIMNRAKYFPGEGVPNYYLSESSEKPGTPVYPVTGSSTDQKALIFWSHGLGNYWRNDSLMIYGNKPGTMYLFAQDPQTHLTCTPIKVEVLSRQTLYNDKQAELAGMTYPFTWDFENIDMTDYVADATDNGGTYWRERWDERDPKDQSVQTYNRHYNVKKNYYQYNGGMNADWDDKDLNGSSRQRWFKDIYANGKYVPEFKGIMLNLSGLDYWEQKFQRFNIAKDGKSIYFEGGPIFVQLPGFGLTQNKNDKLKTELQGTDENPGTRSYDNYIGGEHNHINTAKYNVNEGYTKLLSVDNQHNVDIQYPVQTENASGISKDYRNNKVRFVIKAKGGRTLDRDKMGITIPNDNPNSQFHIGGASMLNENLDVNDIKWSYDIADPTVHNGYSVLNLDNEEAKVYIVELDPYDPELQDHIYLMFNNDVHVYWMAITNEPRNILSDFDGVTYSYPKDIDMTKTNQTLAQQTKSGIYTKASNAHEGTYALASKGTYTKKNVYQVGSTTPDAGTEVQLKAYKVSEFFPTEVKDASGNVIHPAQSVLLSEIEGNIPKNEGVMLYTEPRMSALASNPVGLEPAWYNRGNTAWSEWVERTKTVDGETVHYLEEVFHVAEAKDSTSNGNQYNNSHNYYYLPLYFIAMAENMSETNYNLKKPGSTGGGVWGNDEPAVANGSVNREGANLLRPVTYGKVLGMDYNNQSMINFGYNNEFICRKLVYQDDIQTKEMSDPYVPGPGNNEAGNNHEGIYYYRIGPECAKFYRINTADLNHHNRSAYMTLTWEEYKVNTVGKPINMSSSNTQTDPEANGIGSAQFSPIRFSPSYNPVDIRFDVQAINDQVVSEDGGFVDGISEVEATHGSDAVYNLNGVRVNNLSKGIYIINGKKVVVK
ncbi:MAG: hypothetical protein IKX24_01850 [Prevotella sp.]|nr:hypothetical protein [Prevotella sp.]